MGTTKPDKHLTHWYIITHEKEYKKMQISEQASSCRATDIMHQKSKRGRDKVEYQVGL